MSPLNRVLPQMALSGATVKSATPGRLFLRVVTYSGISALAVTMLSVVLPPLFSNSTSRAVVDVPLTLITSPIAGDVATVSTRLNGRVGEGDAVAAIENTRIDQTTLTGLQNEASSAQVALDGLRAQQILYSGAMADLDRELDLQRAFLIPQARAAEAEARAHTEVAAQKFMELQELASRQRELFTRGVVGPSPLSVAERQAQAAKAGLDAEQAVLARRTAQRAALEAGSFVGSDLGPAADLLIRRRDMQFQAARADGDLASTRSRLAALHVAIDGETRRWTHLSSAQVDAPVNGVISKLYVNAGRHVLAGETLASVVECRKAVVAAIFSIREAPQLQVGTAMMLTGDGWTGPRSGTVTQVMPRTDSQFDQSYAVPFPPIERREMYVLIEPDWARDANLTPQGQVSAPCGTGQWVTATVRDDGGFVRNALHFALAPARTLWRAAARQVVTEAKAEPAM